MARRTLLILMLLAGSAMPAGCDRSSGDVSPDAGQPVLTFVSLTQDFGSIDETRAVYTAFDFTNTGSSELVIEDVTAGCGCTTPLLAKRRYQPGESGRIEVGFKPVRPGPTTKYVTVTANTTEPTTKLSFTANITAFLVVKPKILQFGVRRYGAEHRAIMTVSAEDENFVIDAVTANTPHVTARIVPAGQASAPGPKTVEVTVASSAPWGGLYFGIDITATGRPSPGAGPVTYTRNVRAAGRLFGNLSADPDMFRFAVDPGASIVKKIRLKRPDGKPFRILQTDVRIPALPGATVRVEPESLHTWAITLNATAGPTPGRCPGVVIVTTDVEGERVLELRTLGMIKTPR